MNFTLFLIFESLNKAGVIVVKFLLDIIFGIDYSLKNVAEVSVTLELKP